MVGVAELESATPCVSCKCSNQLSYTPKSIILMIKPHLPYPLQAFFTTNLLQPLENKSKHAIYIIVIHSFSLIFRFLQKKDEVITLHPFLFNNYYLLFPSAIHYKAQCEYPEYQCPFRWLGDCIKLYSKTCFIACFKLLPCKQFPI